MDDARRPSLVGKDPNRQPNRRPAMRREPGIVKRRA